MQRNLSRRDPSQKDPERGEIMRSITLLKVAGGTHSHNGDPAVPGRMTLVLGGVAERRLSEVKQKQSPPIPDGVSLCPERALPPIGT